MLYGLYNNMIQQIMFQLTENIYLKINNDIRLQNIQFINDIDSKIELFKNNFNRLFDILNENENNIEKMEENIIDIKNILEILKDKFSDYLTNYELENTKIDWKKKIETLVNSLEDYNLIEEDEKRIYNLIEQIIELDNINCETYFLEIKDILNI